MKKASVASIFGILLTIGYIGLVSYWRGADFGTTKIRSMAANEFGDLVAGIFAPLAFLWLVIGYARQSKEIDENGKAIEEQGRLLKESIEAQNRLAKAAETQSELLQTSINAQIDLASSAAKQLEISREELALSQADGLEARRPQLILVRDELFTGTTLQTALKFTVIIDTASAETIPTTDCPGTALCQGWSTYMPCGHEFVIFLNEKNKMPVPALMISFSFRNPRNELFHQVLSLELVDGTYRVKSSYFEKQLLALPNNVCSASIALLNQVQQPPIW